MTRNDRMCHAILMDGVVANVIWLVPGTNFPNAVCCGDYNVAIGDSYHDNRFWRDGALILSESEQIQAEADDEIAALIDDVYQGDLLELFGE